MRLLAALVALVMVMLVPLEAVPAHAGTVSVEVCVPARDVETVRCGTPVPEGAPWVLYRVRGLATGEPINLAAACRWTRVTYTAYWCFNVDVAGGSVGFLPGEQVVTVTDAATGRELARATYTVTPQTPAQALEAFRGGRSAWARAGVVLALARLGQLAEALGAAQAMWSSADLFTQYQGYTLGASLLLAQGRAAAAERLAQDLLAWRRAHGLAVIAADYALLARAALAACDLGTAERALGQAALLDPESVVLQRMLVQVEDAKTTSCTPAGGERR